MTAGVECGVADTCTVQLRLPEGVNPKQSLDKPCSVEAGGG